MPTRPRNGVSGSHEWTHTGTGRPIYETMINGKKYNIAVTVGNNGYIVGANLRGSVK